jgi:hypothetical protein
LDRLLEADQAVAVEVLAVLVVQDQLVVLVAVEVLAVLVVQDKLVVLVVQNH